MHTLEGLYTSDNHNGSDDSGGVDKISPTGAAI